MRVTTGNYLAFVIFASARYRICNSDECGDAALQRNVRGISLLRLLYSGLVFVSCNLLIVLTGSADNVRDSEDANSEYSSMEKHSGSGGGFFVSARINLGLPEQLQLGHVSGFSNFIRIMYVGWSGFGRFHPR